MRPWSISGCGTGGWGATRGFGGYGDGAGDFGFGWTSKDSWVLNDGLTSPLLPQIGRRLPDVHLPSRQVTSRVAEAFYWIGRYLERAHHQAD